MIMASMRFRWVCVLYMRGTYVVKWGGCIYRIIDLPPKRTQRTNKICYTGKRRKTCWRWCATAICKPMIYISAGTLFDPGAGHLPVSSIFFTLRSLEHRKVEIHTEDEEDLLTLVRVCEA